VRAYTFWDYEPWQSDLYIKVRVYPQRGLRRWLGYGATGGWYGPGPWELDPDEDDPPPA
jgi:hypothetical protein